MQDSKRLLAIMLAAILSASVLSGAIIAAPLTPVFAQDDDDNQNDDNSMDESETESEDEQDDVEDEHEQESKAELEVEDSEVKVKVEMKGLDLADGLYDTTFSCTDPPTSMSFEEAFEVEEGDGKLDVEFQLNDGTYTGCEVALDEPEMVLASFEAFTVPAGEVNEEEHEADDEENEAEDEEHEEQEDDHKESDSKTKLETDDEEAEVEVEREDLDLENGTYNVTFSCTEPEVSMNFAEALEVEDGKGKFEAEIALELGTYSDCHIAVDGTDTVLAEFDTFTVSEDSEHRVEVTEKVKDKREQIISKVQQVRERVIEARPDLPGPFASGLDYALVATGATADEQAVMTGVDMSAWKSNPAVVIMAVIGGDIQVGDNNYSIEIGYAVYSLRHDVMRMSALAVDDDSGDIVRLVLRGNAVDDTGFPDESGESIDLVFEGSSGPQKNEIAGSELLLEGSLQAT